MDVLPVNYIPGDPMLIENIVWELKTQGIFDTFRKECIADVDTKPAYQNLRQRVEGSVSSFLRKQTWSPDLNKNQLREQLRKNIYESGFLETGVERIVDQVVNPKMSTVFLPKVTDVVYQYLGLEKPAVKSEREKEDDWKIKTEDLLPKELEAVSPESRQDDRNDDSNLSLESMKIDEDESPPFEPLEEDNSIDSHMSGISGLQSHDSNGSPKGLQVDETQASKHSSDGGTAMELDEHVNVESSDATLDVDSSLVKEPNAESTDNKEKEKEKEPEHKSRSRSESKSDKKYERSKDKHRDKSREKEKGRSDKDKHRSSRHDRKKDDRRDKDKYSSSSISSSRRDKEKEREKTSKSRDDKSRSHRDGTRDRKSSSRSERDKDKEKRDKTKERKDDHYSAKHKAERRSTDRDSNDGSGLKSSSSSYCESNSSSQHSHKESTNSNDSGQSGKSDRQESKHKHKEAKHKSPCVSASNVVLDSEVEHPTEIEIRPKTPPSMSVSAASWDALEAQLQSNVSYDAYYDSDHVETAAAEPEEVEQQDFVSLQYFSKASIEKDESNLAKAAQCLAQLEQQVEAAESRLLPKRSLKRRKDGDDTLGSPMKKHRSGNTVGNNLPIPIINDSQNFHLPLSPAESDSDKSTDRKTDDVLPTPQPKRKANIHVTQRYSSDDLYKPRPIIKRTTNRRRGILDTQ